MAQSSSLVRRSDDRLLLAQQGVSTLPSPIALQLLDIPFVLPVQKQPPRENGRLPEGMWRLEYELIGADRTRYRVRVTGDPELGLPFGRDADVLLALFRLLDEERDVHDLATGTFRQPSFQMICRALGLGATGPLVRRIRDALRRLSHVRIESRVLVDRAEAAARLLAQDGSATPAAPTASTVRRHEVEETRWLLEYRTEERTVESRGDAPIDDVTDGSGERVERTLWIHELRLNPFWVGQAISGWAGWIDVERHADLKSITARRLYQLCAAHAARHVRIPWALPEHDLRTACMLTLDGKKPTRVRQMLSEAAAELVEAGVLADHAWRGAPRRGPMTLELTPGPLLQLSGLLRGIGLTDPPDVRVQYALLRAFGVTAPRARALIAEKPGQVAEVLLRACHLRATDPGAVSKSWAGWIIHHVEHDTSFAGEVAFHEWRRTALARLDGQTDARPAAPSAGPSARERAVSVSGPAPAPAPTPVARPAADPDADARWQRVLAVVRPQLSMLDYFGVEDAVAVGGDEGTLVLAVTNDIAARALHRALPRLTTVLGAHDGGPTEIRVVLSTPAA
ncbi:hypothetical protein J421_5508 (plasmid) [Gemmatirosa kalamazoonensis]|uniref:DnaA N-terminal domain-containing protein n=1 Tax=Gemmatirosa kalamazoonensis TaxID=861299 RepID=W0RTX4_9BACT|nr:hypothetical protein [Gemmatirosa kalamazoonensis]AHG93043.1 hypothetical protein J421_5508 [Gemmatirosa kalamazoonensis]